MLLPRGVYSKTKIQFPSKNAWLPSIFFHYESDYLPLLPFSKARMSEGEPMLAQIVDLECLVQLSSGLCGTWYVTYPLTCSVRSPEY